MRLPPAEPGPVNAGDVGSARSTRTACGRARRTQRGPPRPAAAGSDAAASAAPACGRDGCGAPFARPEVTSGVQAPDTGQEPDVREHSPPPRRSGRWRGRAASAPPRHPRRSPRPPRRAAQRHSRPDRRRGGVDTSTTARCEPAATTARSPAASTSRACPRTFTAPNRLGVAGIPRSTSTSSEPRVTKAVRVWMSSAVAPGTLYAPAGPPSAMPPKHDDVAASRSQRRSPGTAHQPVPDGQSCPYACSTRPSPSQSASRPVSSSSSYGTHRSARQAKYRSPRCRLPAAQARTGRRCRA